MDLTVGHIVYANCVPFFYYLPASGFRGRIRAGVPARLNSQLAGGQIDVSPSSSFEYGRNWRSYVLLPDLSISSRGAVQSVLLFSHRPIEALHRQPIALTGESATSVNLLRILLREFYRCDDYREQRPGRPVEEMIVAGGAGLLIGDRAIRAAMARIAPYIYDLGELWWRHTGLPFVFALWIVQRRAAEQKAQALALFQRQLRHSLRRALADLDGLARQSAERSWMGAERLAAYWRAMSYDFAETHRRGVERYFQLAVKHRLLPEQPALRFFGDSFSVDPSGGIH
jgi:chorismate dehydratase